MAGPGPPSGHGAQGPRQVHEGVDGQTRLLMGRGSPPRWPARADIATPDGSGHLDALQHPLARPHRLQPAHRSDTILHQRVGPLDGLDRLSPGAVQRLKCGDKG